MLPDRRPLDLLEKVIANDLSSGLADMWSARAATLTIDAAVRRQLLTSVDASREAFADAVQQNWRRTLSDLATTAETMQAPFCFLALLCPETVLPLGYDEVRYLSTDRLQAQRSYMSGLWDEIFSDDAFGQRLASLGAPLGATKYDEVRHMTELLMCGTQYRAANGTWHDLVDVFDALLPPEPDPNKLAQREESEWRGLFCDSWTGALSSDANNATPSIVSMPSLYVPSGDGITRLHDATSSLIMGIASRRLTLSDLHWRTLEELVADLLSDLGLRVSITKRSNDGGRDVIAKGDLIPGEPTVLAVEVKHRPIVDVGDLRAALWANRHFPALMFVSSGRFTAGVFRERNTSENRLRLFLKDGIALGQWIDAYAQRHRRPAV